MTIVTGLGNPGRKYGGTRHNIGFDVIDVLAKEHGIEISKAKHKAHIGEGLIAGKKVLLVKPQTYMNLSGQSVAEVLRYYNALPENIIVVYDDTALPVGALRIRKQGSAGGHNGIKDIIFRLDTDVFDRVRIGVGEKPPNWDLADYVLSRFNGKAEIDAIINGVDNAAEAVAFMIEHGTDLAMNRFNPLSKPAKRAKDGDADVLQAGNELGEK